MMKKGSLWAIYTASYFSDYILILGILIWKNWKKKQTLLDWDEFIKKTVSSEWIIWGILLVLTVFSILVMIGIRNIPMTTRITYEPKKNEVWESYSGFLAPALALIPSFFGDYGLLVSLLIFIVAGIAFVKSKKVYLASVFIFPMQYKTYGADEGITIISKDSIDDLRLRLADETDGIEAKELVKGVFLVK